MSSEPTDSRKAAERRDGRSSFDERSFYVVPVDREDPRDHPDRDQWLMENVPPHHR